MLVRLPVEELEKLELIDCLGPVKKSGCGKLLLIPEITTFNLKPVEIFYHNARESKIRKFIDEYPTNANLKILYEACESISHELIIEKVSKDAYVISSDDEVNTVLDSAFTSSTVVETPSSIKELSEENFTVLGIMKTGSRQKISVNLKSDKLGEFTLYSWPDKEEFTDKKIPLHDDLGYTAVPLALRCVESIDSNTLLSNLLEKVSKQLSLSPAEGKLLEDITQYFSSAALSLSHLD
ncbi:hypothetical protein CONCODRAFT_9784 [Conidiobolus coronatus NRRL 28638]|uniref:Uncharacterized protein n=1 Tax=Conidiobolus coronatus (strain ATCC 28846 / CBS 209.66 / NRRL 28638) TaxID=796925 RepID=A0A137NZ69_CONC2|nr:hypothetical protein CONCODRAFT_9784 [Conidiobolus coronatus NRRL 28638]|eukprot:KXN68057.1 hypothetical protein CONCODRAFT_9784 [Conidiobolus coronatus NRRL 28638]